jgi:hypothetical protein
MINYSIFGSPSIADHFDPRLVQIYKYCSVTGDEYSVTVEKSSLQKYKSGNYLIQECFPDLTPQERDFIKFGCTPPEWEKVMGPPID